MLYTGYKRLIEYDLLMVEFAGNYPLESHETELARLRVQSAAMAPEARAMLERIGVGEGWRCLDAGCGPAGLAGMLREMVGTSGWVVGLDRNEGFLEAARQADGRENVEFRLGDVYQTGFEESSLDLVHFRFVASTAGAPERLLAEALRVVKPGGTVALQEPDGSTLRCWPPCEAWDRLRGALLGAFAGVGADLELARRLYAVVRGAGLEDVQYRTFVLGVRAGDAMADYLPATVESLRGTVLRLGLLGEAEFDRVIAECREHLRRPETSFTMYTVAQVWGRKRAG